MSADVIHDKNTARLLFRPRSVRPKIDVLFPEEKSVGLGSKATPPVLCGGT